MSEGCTNCGDGMHEATACESCDMFFSHDDMQPINGDMHCGECYEDAMNDYWTQQQCIEAFEELCPVTSFIMLSGSIDLVARQQAFNDYTDGLCKDGHITQEQSRHMINPY